MKIDKKRAENMVSGENTPFYQGNLKELIKDELNTNYFLSDLDKICEMAEPFTNCDQENNYY